MANKFCFNNSVAIVNGREVEVFRCIQAAIKSKEHPWHFWCNGSDIFERETGEKYNYKKSFETFVKCRGLEGSKIIKNNRPEEPAKPYSDTTGIKIGTLVIDDILNGGTDARIARIGHRYFLTYNVVTNKISAGNHVHAIVMVYRQFDIFEDYLYLGPERYMFPERELIEKNCVIDEDGLVVYGLNGQLELLELETGKTLYLAKTPKIDHMYFSPGSSPIRFNGNMLGVGHVKIEYKNIKNTRYRNFIRDLNWHGIKKHGKFIYMNFFYEYNKNGFYRSSPAFVISSGTYYLNFAMGLFASKNGYTLSYGDGDDSMRRHEFTAGEINELLAADFELRVVAKYVLVYGYYNRQNTGDDAFVEVFKWLYRGRSCHLVFRNPEEPIPAHDYVYIILGGGDVLNDYFLMPLIRMFPNTPVYAVGVGMPYFNNNCEFLKLILARNKTFFGKPQKYIPDLAFFLSRICSGSDQHETKISSWSGCVKPVSYGQEITSFSARKKIGLAIPATWHNKEHSGIYARLCESLSQTLSIIAYLENADIYFIPFCHNESEGDVKIFKDLNVKNMVFADIKADQDQAVWRGGHLVYETLEFIKTMDFMICGRFHAHVFATIQQVPFISIGSSPKCKNFMQEMGVANLHYNLQSNSLDLPTFAGPDFVDFCRKALANGQKCPMPELDENFMSFAKKFGK